MKQAQSLLRRMLSCGLIAAVLAVTSSQANAQEVTVRGSGTCQAYLDAKSSHSIPEAVKHLTWFLGYVSGLAAATHVNILDKDDGRVNGQLGGRLLRPLPG